MQIEHDHLGHWLHSVFARLRRFDTLDLKEAKALPDQLRA
jgi:hypothetical protein